MDLQLNKKVILVTGGAQGIGAAIVRAAAEEGAVPVVVDRCPGGDNQITTELTKPENCRSAVQETLDRFGRLDAVVNNAGVNDRVGLERGSPEEYVASLERNLFHYYNIVHYALEALKKSQGSIVNIASK